MKIIDEETFPFVCDKCMGMWECDVVIDDICICPWCEQNLYNSFKGEIEIIKNDV